MRCSSKIYESLKAGVSTENYPRSPGVCHIHTRGRSSVQGRSLPCLHPAREGPRSKDPALLQSIQCFLHISLCPILRPDLVLVPSELWPALCCPTLPRPAPGPAWANTRACRLLSHVAATERDTQQKGSQMCVTQSEAFIKL